MSDIAKTGKPRRYFGVTCARSGNSGEFEWTEVTLVIEREFNFNDADQRRDLLTSLESARDLFFREKEKE